MSTTAHFSLAEYDRMIRSEVFDRRERRLELIRGDDEIRPLAVPEMVLRPSMLWGVNPIGPARSI